MQMLTKLLLAVGALATVLIIRATIAGVDGSGVFLRMLRNTAYSCAEGDYTRTRYASVPLLGRTLSLTVDISSAECGCNAAWYLVSMAQNTASPGMCDGDFYCDASNVCGVRCAEIDLMEANKHAFHAVLHTAADGNGVGNGLGGGWAGLPNDGS